MFFFNRIKHIGVALLFVYLFIGCQHAHDSTKLRKLSGLPDHIKDSVYLYSENNFSVEKEELGRYLFYDRRLSVNNTKACATCHAQEFAFTDRYNRSIGALGDLHQRNSRPLFNLVLNTYLTAADSTLHFPEQQIVNPMFNAKPVELGWTGNEKLLVSKIGKESIYQRLFAKAFPKEKNPVTVQNIQKSITSFIKNIFSFSSSYDRHLAGDSNALNESEKRGQALFFSDSLRCTACHGGINFNHPKGNDFFNIGLYNLQGNGNYPGYDQGLFELTNNIADMGKYKVPTLRNLIFTAPYFHDGSAQSIEDVIKVYEQGGRKIDSGIYKGDGRMNPYKSSLISGFKLNSQQRIDLINFLFSLTDSSVIKNPAYSNPFHYDETK